MPPGPQAPTCSILQWLCWSSEAHLNKISARTSPRVQGRGNEIGLPGLCISPSFSLARCSNVDSFQVLPPPLLCARQTAHSGLPWFRRPGHPSAVCRRPLVDKRRWSPCVLTDPERRKDEGLAGRESLRMKGNTDQVWGDTSLESIWIPEGNAPFFALTVSSIMC